MNKKLGGVVIAEVEQLGRIIATTNDEQKIRKSSSYERFEPMKGWNKNMMKNNSCERFKLGEKNEQELDEEQ